MKRACFFLAEVRRLVLCFAMSSALFLPQAAALTTSSYADNFAIPENQPGALAQEYEVQSASKMSRGLQNFFLGFLEVFHGVKVEVAKRNAEYLPFGIEQFFIGLGNGIGNTAKRMGVGLYEIFTFPYAQGPILEDMSDWLY